MNEQEYKQHLEDIKQNEPDLYEDLEETEAYIETRQKTGDKKGRNNVFMKLTVGVIAMFLVLTSVGTLINYFNIPSMEFLQKSKELSKQEQIQSYKEAVVTIETGHSKGTGFNVSEEGFIITNHHVIENAPNVNVYFPNGFFKKATVVDAYPNLDIAFLKIEAEEALPFLTLEEEKNWKKGDHITFIGNPLMHHQIANEGTLAGEKASSSLDKQAMLLDAPVYKGNSGSPVLNEEGNVIGVIYATTNMDMGGDRQVMGLAVPVVHFSDYVQDY